MDYQKLVNLIKTAPGLSERLEGLGYEAIAQELNKIPKVPNPQARQQVRVKRNIYDYLDLLEPEDVEKLSTKGKNMINLNRELGEAMGLNHRFADLTDLLPVLVKIGVSETSLQRIAAKAAETEEDPTYQELVDGPSVADDNGLGVVTPAHVQIALNMYRADQS